MPSATEVIIPKGIKPLSKWVVPTDIGSIQFDKIVPFPNTDWKEQLSLIGEYTQPDLTNLHDVTVGFEDWVVKNNMLIPGKELKGVGGHCRSSVCISAETYPVYPIEGVEVELMSYYSIALWYYDDAIPEYLEGRTSREINICFDKFNKILRRVLTGGFDRIEDIVKDSNYDDSLIKFKAIFEIFFYAWKVGGERVPNFTEPGRLDNFLNAYVDYANGMKLYLNPKFGDWYTEESYRWLRIPDMALKPYTDFGYACINFRPRAEIRHHILYRMIRDYMTLGLGIVNDIFAIARDIETKNDFNFLLLRVKWERISLKEAMEQSIVVYNSFINQLHLSMNALIDEFEGDPEVLETVKVCKNAANGCATFYISTCRYGPLVAKTPILRFKSE